ncbi:MAG: tryptophan 2,3-dioxygenase [Bdellovibrionales bacterium]|nr:tryptophan 2,3-dioxygenase [Bdellovibrionales bacterium]
MKYNYPPIDYDKYLMLDKILNAQKLRSEEFKNPAHDEMLFIIVHQTYELWFKQILTELKSIGLIFENDFIDERDMALIVNRLQRVTKILRILLDQIEIIETMTPLDFLEFRDMLFPASGFQSFQFRMVENLLGLKSEQRLKYNSHSYDKSLPEDIAPLVKKIEDQPSLFDRVNAWLERTPFLNLENFDFWNAYKTAVKSTFNSEASIVKNHSGLSENDIKRNLEIIDQARSTFETLFDENAYNEAVKNGQWRLSYKSIHAALLIQLYRDQPILQLPFELIKALLDLDETMTTWRYRHALMAKRMLGTKIGTGGSSGYDYLKQTSEKHKIFNDFFQLTTFFIPRSALPELPKEVQDLLGFRYGHTCGTQSVNNHVEK